MINGERTNEIFMSLKLHFSSESYDFLKYKGRMKNRTTNYPAQTLAGKLVSEKNVVRFFLFNMIADIQEKQNIRNYIGDYNNKDSFTKSYVIEGLLDGKNYQLAEWLKIFLKKNDIAGLKDFDVISEFFFDQKNIIIPAYIMASDIFDWKTEDPLHQELLFYTKKVSLFMAPNKKKIYEVVKNTVNSTI